MPADTLKYGDGEATTTDKQWPGLIDQVRHEHELGFKHMESKWKTWRMRLKLYNNQRREPSAVGDTTLFTVQQTVVASLYNDQLDVGFGGREEGDDEQAQNLEQMAKFDHQEMNKDVLDFNWIWDTAFFGRGIVSMEQFVRDPENGQFYPVPRVISPLVFIRDPDATSINGQHDTGEGSARFFGFQVRMSQEEMENNPFFFDNLNYSTIEYRSVPNQHNLWREERAARDTAQGRQNSDNQRVDESLGANGRYDVLVWYTFYKDEESGETKRIRCWIGNGTDKLLGVQELKEDYWKFIDRSLYPIPNDWDGVSIPDLVEDKQRARAVIQNLILRAMKSDAYQTYIYDQNKIKNRHNLQPGFDKYIPIDAKNESVANAITPMQKTSPNMSLVDYILNTLDMSAQKATATPDIQQGIQSQQRRTLGETNLQVSRVDTRYSLAAKIFGWSEVDFWQTWYNMYYDYFADDIDEKVLRLSGALGAKWRTLKKEDFITRTNPDIMIESREVNRARELEERDSLLAYFQLALPEPTANRRWGLKKLGKMYGLTSDEIDRLYPPTIDERVARDENDRLNNDEFVPVERDQDHNVHLETHTMARETPEALAHIKTHEEALRLQRSNPELFPALGQSNTNFQNDTDIEQFVSQLDRGSQVGQPLQQARNTAQPVNPSQTSGTPA